ncbi:hypothetical protein MLD38_003668 [Melastoma candidum]|uniref:Uncharacterized protein n=1 Tax=Melastoma candidum TaxID=119954 RepID=A0ACB9S6H8_9MYRT|nr:hypothetical protein MLD38_003668 [Melastoma candidum]
MVKGRQGERVRLYVRGTILGYKRIAKDSLVVEFSIDLCASRLTLRWHETSAIGLVKVKGVENLSPVFCNGHASPDVYFRNAVWVNGFGSLVRRIEQ